MTTQAELIAAVSKDAGVSQADAGRVLESFVKTIHASLIDGGDVRISNLGVFDTADRAAREGRNPATGETIKIAASKAVRFRVSKPLKDAVNK
ncbi:DNA-binding protein [Brevundimonas sp. LM2]|uniref:HU family DNA-binding protein n=1 Tax=Brevundimonas sp. LM2 TaxID=1938605 RepID=UPI00098408FB|nr:HU family DNA-binding protein [Brevundimonas sp. LM2]AQR61129.1 DNA-binding protein [Brevundimonas sp. LM2]